MSARRTTSSLASLLLVQRLVESSAAPLKAGEFWSLVDRVADPGELLGEDEANVAHRLDGDAELAARVVALFDAATALAFELDDLEQSGLRVLTPFDDDYPPTLITRLVRSAPPVLYAAGDPHLLTHRLLGIVGSREVTEDGAAVARAAAVVAAGRGFGLVSGGARGVDRLAMQAALEADAVVVGVLADSLRRVLRESEVRRAITDGRLCMCTPFKPTAGFSVANAMARNKLIYALSEVTFVVASDLETGGTWAGATEALRLNYGKVAVWVGDGVGAGNSRLVDLGAAPVAEINDLDHLLCEPTVTSAGTRQLSFGV
jgi:predicted Rossmann fold nucleotide-binding protein DprA/Smf involved in DNA uptake